MPADLGTSTRLIFPNVDVRSRFGRFGPKTARDSRPMAPFGDAFPLGELDVESGASATTAGAAAPSAAAPSAGAALAAAPSSSPALLSDGAAATAGPAATPRGSTFAAFSSGGRPRGVGAIAEALGITVRWSFVGRCCPCVEQARAKTMGPRS